MFTHNAEQDEGEHESGDVEAAPPPEAPIAPPVVPGAPPPRTRTPPPPASYHVSAAPLVATRPAPPTTFNQCATSESVRQQSPLQTTNPYARSSTLSHGRPMPEMTAQAAVINVSVDEPTVSHEVLDLITPTNNVTTSQSASIASRSQCSQSANEADKEPMSFAELQALISRLQADPELYRKYQQKVFVVPCKMKGSHQYFNIRKKQHRDKKNKDDKVNATENVLFFLLETSKKEITLMVVLFSMNMSWKSTWAAQVIRKGQSSVWWPMTFCSHTFASSPVKCEN